jgi:CRP/FNR family transcriptional regulator, cyclic AMP receptor protein
MCGFDQQGFAMKQDAGFSVLTGNNIEARFFKAGDVIFREGEEAKELFVIKSGQVRIQLGNRTVTELATDSIFGEMALIDSEPRSATAVAVTDVELVPGVGKAIPVSGQPDPLLRAQGHARARPTVESYEQNFWLVRGFGSAGEL